MTDRYILKDGVPVPEPDLLKWGKWFQGNNERIISRTEVGEALVSTVFLGLDHRFSEDEEGPILFETMVFFPCVDEGACAVGKKGHVHEEGIYTRRYCTKEQAQKGHKEVVEQLKEDNQK